MVFRWNNYFILDFDVFFWFSGFYSINDCNLHLCLDCRTGIIFRIFLFIKPNMKVLPDWLTSEKFVWKVNELFIKIIFFDLILRISKTYRVYIKSCNLYEEKVINIVLKCIKWLYVITFNINFIKFLSQLYFSCSFYLILEKIFFFIILLLWEKFKASFNGPVVIKLIFATIIKLNSFFIIKHYFSKFYFKSNFIKRNKFKLNNFMLLKF